MTQLDLQQRLEQAEDRVKALENIQLANLEVKLNLAERAKKAEAECYELQQQVDEYSLILDGLPKDAIDGGWTAKGISDYAAKMEQQVKALAAENVALISFIDDECYIENHRTGASKCAGHDKPTSPNADAIKRQWMAEGLMYAINELPMTMSMAGKLNDLATQLRQPEGKGQ